MRMDAVYWGVEPLWQRLVPLLPGLSIEVLARVESTNALLLERARPPARASGETDSGFGRRAGDTQPCLLVAEHQSGGRGRMGRSWQSAPGASLTFSLGLVLQRADLAGLSLAVGVALAEALDTLAPAAAPGAAPAVSEPDPAGRDAHVWLKWPNDLWLLDRGGGGRKLGGILIESMGLGPGAGAGRLVVIGVGINVQPINVLGELSSGFACLAEIAPHATPQTTLARLAEPLVRALLQFDREGFAPFAARFARRDLLRGRTVRITQGGAAEGVAEGVDPAGALLLHTPQGCRALSSGEVSVQLQPLPASSPGA